MQVAHGCAHRRELVAEGSVQGLEISGQFNLCVPITIECCHAGIDVEHVRALDKRMGQVLGFRRQRVIDPERAGGLGQGAGNMDVALEIARKIRPRAYRRSVYAITGVGFRSRLHATVNAKRLAATAALGRLTKTPDAVNRVGARAEITGKPVHADACQVDTEPIAQGHAAHADTASNPFDGRAFARFGGVIAIDPEFTGTELTHGFRFTLRAAHANTFQGGAKNPAAGRTGAMHTPTRTILAAVDTNTAFCSRTVDTAHTRRKSAGIVNCNLSHHAGCVRTGGIGLAQKTRLGTTGRKVHAANPDTVIARGPPLDDNRYSIEHQRHANRASLTGLVAVEGIRCVGNLLTRRQGCTFDHHREIAVGTGEVHIVELQFNGKNSLGDRNGWHRDGLQQHASHGAVT